VIHNQIVLFDFETGGNDPDSCELTQVAAIAMNPRTLNLYDTPDAVFNSNMRPLDMDAVQDKALQITKKTREEIAEYPHPEEVWHNFARWMSRWNHKGSSSFFNLPIPAGHNIINFDLPITTRYCLKYGTYRTEDNGRKVQNIFHGLHRFDTMSMCKDWFFDLDEPGKLSLDYLRKYFGMPKESLERGHDALQDVRDAGAILERLLKLYRKYAPGIIFKDCFDPVKVAAEQERRRKSKERKSEREENAKRFSRGKEYAA
jgi:DNA polymerase III epsilon subunit-like protein